MDSLQGHSYVIKNFSRITSEDKQTQEAALREAVALGTPVLIPLLQRLQFLDGLLLQQSKSLSVSEHKYEVARIKHSVEQTLVDIGKSAIAPLVDMLQENDARTRARAAHLLKQIGEPAIEPVLALLHHSDSDVRASVAFVLSGIDDERAVSALQIMLRKAVRVNRRTRAHMLKKKIFVLSIVLLFLGLAGHFILGMHSILWLILIQSFIVGSMVDGTFILRRNAVSGMAKMAKPHMVGAFAACLEDRDKEVRREATEALKRLLPQVKASDKQHISDAEMALLLKSLDGMDDTLLLAILKALEQIGDETALPKVEHIAQAKEFYPAEVKAAAQECLPFLQQRVEQSRQANTLLRGSEVATAPGMLLRATQEEASVQTEQLLRPTS